MIEQWSNFDVKVKMGSFFTAREDIAWEDIKLFRRDMRKGGDVPKILDKLLVNFDV